VNAVGHHRGVHIDPEGCAVLALHWQVEVIKLEGFFGLMLSEPVAAAVWSRVLELLQ
jgi:hypothetical protein